MTNEKVEILLKSAVKSVDHTQCTLADGRKLPFGLMVWSTGLAPVEIVENMKNLKKERGRIVVDALLRVPGVDSVFAMGDAAINPERPLGPLAQVADQQGKVRHGGWSVAASRPYVLYDVSFEWVKRTENYPMRYPTLWTCSQNH